MSAAADIARMVAAMGPISLGEMDRIRLMNRVDTKYVTTEEVLAEILGRAAASGYRCCEILGNRITGYDSVYYDTGDHLMYRMHHNGIKVRQKVRVRTYRVNSLTFLEIKRKNNKGRTKKKRTALPGELAMDFGKDPQAAAFLAEQSWFKAEDLSPATGTSFDRITLVNAAETERLTIDMNLRFENFRSGLIATLGRGVVIELKQDGRAASQFREILREVRVHPLRVSKYCIGTALTDPEIKKGRFKPRIRAIEKITGEKLLHHDTI